MTELMKLKRIRAGLYLYKPKNQPFEIQIERLDKQSEHYPGDAYYNMWRIYQYWTAHYEIWLWHFYTLDDAKTAVMKELEND